MKITQEEVRHVATLAKLSLTSDEAVLYAEQLSAVLDYVEQLDELEVDAIEGTFQVIDGLVNCWREDQIRPGFTQEEALSQAPSVHKGYFVVGRII